MSNKSYITTSDKESNPNFIPPPTTGSNAIKSKAGTKCPFLKTYHAIYWSNSLDKFYEDNFYNFQYIDHIEERPQDCIGKDCICWTPIGCSRK